MEGLRGGLARARRNRGLEIGHWEQGRYTAWPACMFCDKGADMHVEYCQSKVHTWRSGAATRVNMTATRSTLKENMGRQGDVSEHGRGTRGDKWSGQVLGRVDGAGHRNGPSAAVVSAERRTG